MKIVYACGDSHTAGGETADHLLWPDQHPGFYGLDDLALRDPRQLQRWREFRERRLRAADPVNHDAWQVAENAHAWPTKLGRELSDSQVINAAVIGQSMDWVARQTITDIGDLIDKHAARDITAVIQPPTHVRMQTYDSTNSRWRSFQLGMVGDMDPHVHGWFVANEDECSLLTRWMLNLIGLCGTMDHLRVRIILISAGMPDMADVLEQHRVASALRGDTSTAGVRRIYDSLCGQRWHPRSMRDMAKLVNKPHCPDLHWRSEVHTVLAQDLADSYDL